MQAPDGRRENNAASSAEIDSASHQGRLPRGSFWANAGLMLVSAVVTLVLLEVGFRVAFGLPVFRFADWRTEHVITSAMSEIKAVVDPVLGWTTRPWSVHEDGYTTIDYGVRQNFDERTIRTGAVLASGDSFTEGWEVKDAESWPAQLEKLIEVPVVNAGVGSYGADQTVLRAEQLLPIVKPKILILGFHEVAISRVGYSVYGAPKPWFDVIDGDLHYNPPPAVDTRPEGGSMPSVVYRFRDALGYSAAADYVLARLARSFWYATETDWDYRDARNNPTEVVCLLLKRLKARTDSENVQLLVFLQYYATVVIGRERATYNIRRVSDCAKTAGIRVVDHLPPLRAIERAKPGSMSEYYNMYDGELYGHMTAKGNGHAAHLLAPALQDWLPAITGISHTAATPAAPTGPQPVSSPQ
jgi:hypothetical protein